MVQSYGSCQCSACRLMLVKKKREVSSRYLKRLSSYRADTICDRQADRRTDDLGKNNVWE